MKEGLFRPLREEPVDEAALQHARTAVLARLGRSRPGGRLRLAWVAVAAAALIWTGWHSIPPVPDGSPLGLAVLARLPLPPSAPVPVRLVRRERPAPIRPEPPPPNGPIVEQVLVNPAPPDDTTAPEGVILKLASNNPDVILYWLMDEQGD